MGKGEKSIKTTDQQLADAQFNLFSRLKFINEELISNEAWKKAFLLTQYLDVDDTDFVALTIYLNRYLWTGDKVLHAGLKRLNFERVFNTAELSGYYASL